MKQRLLWLGLLALLSLWPVATVFADEPVFQFDGGRIFVDEDVVLGPTEIFEGDLGVLNGDLTVPAGSTVNGDVFVTNGDAEIAGLVNGAVAVISGDLSLAESAQVQGDVFGMSGDQEIAGHVGRALSLLFGDLALRSTAVVGGDLVVVSGNYERAPGAQVLGNEMPEVSLPNIPAIPQIPNLPNLPSVPQIPELPKIPTIPELPESPQMPGATPAPWPGLVRPEGDSFGHRVGQFVGRTFVAGFLGLIFVGLGVLIALIWPRATRRVSECIAVLPAQSFGLGLLTFLIALGLEALAAVLMILIILVAALLIGTVILIPLGLLLLVLSGLVLLPVPLALAGAVVLGWVSLADLIGRKVLGVFRVTEVKPLPAVLVGLLITVGLVAILWILKPLCCGWPFLTLLTSVGLGAVFHTRFGTQGCRQSMQAQSGPLPVEAMDQEVGEPDHPNNATP